MAKANPAEVQKFLEGIKFPATRDEVVKYAERNGADEDAVSMLQELPDQTFNSSTDVTVAMEEAEADEVEEEDDEEEEEISAATS